MGSGSGQGLTQLEDHHQMEEEIGVEVKKILRSNMPGTVGPLRELTEQENRIFADDLLESVVEAWIPPARAERKLMEPRRDAPSGSGRRKRPSGNKGRRRNKKNKRSKHRKDKKR
ncbi:MAG: hypothetical protein HQM02_01520 [Magnetococcales bacterium]|nr:hypothetical protein [Magnetococcales bacterium]